MLTTSFSLKNSRMSQLVELSLIQIAPTGVTGTGGFTFSLAFSLMCLESWSLCLLVVSRLSSLPDLASLIAAQICKPCLQCRTLFSSQRFHHFPVVSTWDHVFNTQFLEDIKEHDYCLASPTEPFMPI